MREDPRQAVPALGDAVHTLPGEKRRCPGRVLRPVTRCTWRFSATRNKTSRRLDSALWDPRRYASRGRLLHVPLPNLSLDTILRPQLAGTAAIDCLRRRGGHARPALPDAEETVLGVGRWPLSPVVWFAVAQRRSFRGPWNGPDGAGRIMTFCFRDSFDAPDFQPPAAVIRIRWDVETVDVCAWHGTLARIEAELWARTYLPSFQISHGLCGECAERYRTPGCA